MRLRSVVRAAPAALLALWIAPAAPARVHPKRGVASARYLSTRPARLSALGAAWAYDWSSTPPPVAGGPPWVPMVWGSGSVAPAVIDSLEQARRSGRARELLGFNEPDSDTQSNLTPAQAVALWPQLERTGLRLGSPAPAVAGDGWLTTFMALARTRHLRVDFIALHYYQDFTNPRAVSDLRRQLIAIHHRYGKPIWITEVGALDLRRWNEPMDHAPSVALAIAYMRELFPVLDRLPFVERYAWFTDSCSRDRACPFSSLFGPGGRLTETGMAFEHAP